jgi:hypothetical protein
LVSANEIPPGQEGQITVSVKVGASRRQVRQAVQVYTNIPEQERLLLTVTATVLVDVDVLQPSILRFDNRQTVPQVTIKNFTDTPIEILKLVAPNEYVTLAASANIIPAQGEMTVRAKLSPATPDGVLSKWVEVHTNLSSQPIVYIRLWGNLQSERTQ